MLLLHRWSTQVQSTTTIIVIQSLRCLFHLWESIAIKEGSKKNLWIISINLRKRAIKTIYESWSVLYLNSRRRISQNKSFIECLNAGIIHWFQNVRLAKTQEDRCYMWIHLILIILSHPSVDTWIIINWIASKVIKYQLSMYLGIWTILQLIFWSILEIEVLSLLGKPTNYLQGKKEEKGRKNDSLHRRIWFRE